MLSDPIKAKLKAAGFYAASLLLLLLVALFSFNLWESYASGSWPRTPGTVFKSYADHLCPGRNKRWAARVAYRYTVDGQTREARRVGNADPVFCDVDRDQVIGWLRERYPVGKAVEVSYNPSDPGAAFLEAGQVSAVDIGFTLLFFALMIVTFRAALRARPGARGK